MRGRHIWIVLAMCGLAREAASTEHPRFVHDMHQLLVARGATRAVAEMTATGDWGRVIARISSGDIGAISLVRDLAKGTDASTSEELTISLAEALPKAPRDVLAVLTPDPSSILSYGRVCSAPFIEDTSEHQRAYKAAALKALRSAFRSRDPDVVRAGEHCVAELKKVKS